MLSLVPRLSTRRYAQHGSSGAGSRYRSTAATWRQQLSIDSLSTARAGAQQQTSRTHVAAAVDRRDRPIVAYYACSVSKLCEAVAAQQNNARNTFFSISKITCRQNNSTAAACLLKRDFCERKDQLCVHATTELSRAIDAAAATTRSV